MKPDNVLKIFKPDPFADPFHKFRFKELSFCFANQFLRYILSCLIDLFLYLVFYAFKFAKTIDL